MGNRIIYVFLAILFAFPSKSLANDGCRAILANGFYNNTVSLSKSQHASAEQAFYCSASLQEAKSFYDKSKSSSSGGSLGGGYGPFSASGSTSSSNSESLTQEQYNQWKSQNCGNSSAEDSAQKFDFLSQNLVDQAVVNAWLQCMTNVEGLSCWATPQEDDVFVRLNWKKQSMSKPQVVSSYVANGTSQFDGAPTGKLVKSEYRMNPGTIEIPVKRIDLDVSVRVSLNLEHDGVNYSCTVSAPANTPPPTAPVDEFASVSPRVVLQRNLGCDVRPFDGMCVRRASAKPTDGNALCGATFTPTSGPTQGATFTISSSPEAAEVTVQVISSTIPFGPGHWLIGDFIVTEVPAAMPLNVRRAKGCTL